MSLDSSTSTEDRCWVHIGVWGDSSCPRLGEEQHCRNCPTYISAGRALLERRPPDDYIEHWTALIAEPKVAGQTDAAPHLVFRVGRSWLALPAPVMREVTMPTRIGAVPHHASDVLLGLVTVRGEVHLCMSLHALIAEPAADLALPGARFLVVEHRTVAWVLPVDEVDGIYDVDLTAVSPLPLTLAQSAATFSKGLTTCGARTVGVVDDELVFSTFGRRIE